MRTWLVSLGILDDARVLAQHREIHAIIGSIMSTKKQAYRHHPAVKQYNNEHFGCLVDYHAETVMEMECRGWKGHKTPISSAVYGVAKFPYPHLPHKFGSWNAHVAWNEEFGPAGQSIQKDLHDLIERWTKEDKDLRNLDATYAVMTHAPCTDARCMAERRKLVASYLNAEAFGTQHISKGNSSLRNARP